MRQETGPLINQEASTRIKIYTAGDMWCQTAVDFLFLAKAQRAYIQNIKITVDFTNFLFLTGPTDSEIAPVFSFAKSMVKKKKCVLIFKDFDLCIYRDQSRKLLQLLNT